MDYATHSNTTSDSKLGLAALTPHKTDEEIRLYSHSDVFYWWPVWTPGFVLAFITYLDGVRLAVVPAGTTARRDWRSEMLERAIEDVRAFAKRDL